MTRGLRLLLLCLVAIAGAAFAPAMAAEKPAAPSGQIMVMLKLPATHFRGKGRKLMLVFEHQMVDLVADRVGNRFKQLARLIGRSGSIVQG